MDTIDDFRAILDATVNGIIVLDPELRVRYVNQRAGALFRVEPEQLLGTDVRDSLMPAMRARVQDPEGYDLRTQFFNEHLEEESRDELHLNLSGAETRILQRFGGPIQSDTGRFLGRIEVYTDVTAQRRAEQVKDEFLSIAAHELKTPITSLKGYAQLLQRAAARGDGGLEPAKMTERLTAMMRQIDRLAHLVDDLLEVSRIQSGPMTLRSETVELGELARHVIDRFRSDPAFTGQHHFELRDLKRPLIGYWDPGRLDQVLTNLLSNAVKYAPGGGLIQIRLGRTGDMAKVSVSDEGIGIPAHDVDKLFQPFSRAANASVRNFGGIGLGLFISRDIIERHGGEIRVESQEGKGSTFYFTLPLRHRSTGSLESDETDEIDAEESEKGQG
ncbi:MAG: sensor histidine kinase [Dehalococcoidia bacterium]